MADILIENGLILPMDGFRRAIRGDIAITGDRISALGRGLKVKAEVVIDASHMAVLPGLVNAHTHLSMTLLRGVADDIQLMEWLETQIWPIERNLTADDCYAGALLGCLEMIKSGTTCFADQYFFMEHVARAVEEAGLRGVLSYGIIEKDDPARRESELRAGEELVKSCQGKANGRVLTMFGPHAAYTCSPECLTRVKELAKQYRVGIHIHLSESQEEVRQISERYGRRPVEHLEALGFLGPEVLAAHCIWLTDDEIATLRKRGVKPVHNPVSNMKIACGTSPVQKMLAAGIPVALGTDGAASNNSLDMFREMKFAALLGKAHDLDPTALPAWSVLEMATINGARALGLEKEIGSLEAGKKADLVLVDLRKPHLTPLHNVASHLVYSVTGGDIDTVIVDGKILMRGRRVLTLDEYRVLEGAQKVSEGLLARRG